MAFNLVDGGGIDHRSNRDAGFRPRTHLHRIDAGLQLGSEGVVDARLHENAVGADAGLAAIAELGRKRAFNGKVEIGIVEDDEGCIAAKLEAEPLDAIGRPAHQQRADAVEPVKEILRTVSLAINSLPIFVGIPVTILITPAGMPARSASTPSASAE